MKMKSTLLVVSAFAFAFMLASCGGSKKATDNGLGKEVNLPCNDDEYHSDAKYFRGTGNGISMDLSTAKSKARIDAQTNLSRSISTTMKSVADRYINERQIGEASEFEQKFDQMTREVINQQLNNVAVACSKTFQKEGKYQVFQALEVAKDEVLNNIKDRISKDDKLKLDYDKMKFEQVFNEEMDKLAKDQQ
ncbi:MAG: hypothetical protein H6537_02455 [Bacteroidales bacterium]|nr:hypothetical protein [Bacteroidales bacterium]HPD94355.1 hypothetical protein [Tenuifilaceae bacterium]HRX30870.1 hypothetical protein [Tenuifilaceae bacterium]